MAVKMFRSLFRMRELGIEGGCGEIEKAIGIFHHEVRHQDLMCRWNTHAYRATRFEAFNRSYVTVNTCPPVVVSYKDVGRPLISRKGLASVGSVVSYSACHNSRLAVFANR